MNREQHLAVLRTYDERFATWEEVPADPGPNLPVGMGRGIKHAMWLARGTMRRLESDEEVPEDEVERCVGFVQSILWVHGIYSLSELESHLEPPEAEG